MSGQTFNESRIDKGVSQILLGLIIIGFFILVIWGMKGVQEHAENVATEAESSDMETPVFDLAN